MRFQTKKKFLLFFMPGFLLGILYVNFAAADFMAESGIFSKSFLRGFSSVEIDSREYVWYLLQLRLVPFLVLAGLAATRFSRISVILFLVWTGISGGVLISCAVLELGMPGSLLCLAGLFPQFIFYIPAYLVLLCYGYTVPRSRWNRQKTLFVSLMMFMGIITELYVNPFVLKTVLSVFSQAL